jgi:hypothetical protein
MQRDILRACEEAKPGTKGLPWYKDMDGNAYDESEAYGISWLRWQVARLRGGVCEEDCRAGLPAFLRNRCHYDAMVVLHSSPWALVCIRRLGNSHQQLSWQQL